MKRAISATVILGALSHAGTVPGQTGVMPIPQIDTAVVDTTVEIVEANGGQPTQYIYRYTVTNPASSSNSLYKFSLDISGVGRNFRRPTLTTVPKRAGTTTRSIEEEIDLLFPFFGPNGDGVVPIGLECPPGWNGGLRKNATVVCYSSNGAPEINPGESMAGFSIHSRFPPMLRELDATAFWTVVVDSLDDDILDIDREAAYDVLESIRRPQLTLAPSFAFPIDREHYVWFVRDLVELKSLGWIPNVTLANELTTIVEDAGELFRIGQGSAAKLKLDAVVTALANTTDTDILPIAATFLLVSVDSIQEFGSNTFPFGGLDARVRFTPAATELNVGSTYELEVFAFRLNNSDFRTGVVEKPVPNRTIFFGCDEFAPVDPAVNPCPNFPEPDNRIPVVTDTNGIATLSFVGDLTGRDHVELCLDSFCESDEGTATVDWVSEVDLVVLAFSPPLIKAASGEVIRFTDRTANLGVGATNQSVTRFYISDSEIVDPTTAIVAGERVVPALQPGEVSEKVDMDFTLPPGFPLGVHHLIACADADSTEVESNELNNCSDSILDGFEFKAIPVADFEDLVRVSAIDQAIEEGDTGVSIVLVDVELSERDPNAEIVVAYEIDDGSATTADNDYLDTSGIVTFLAGTGSQTQQIAISIVGDRREEDDETLAVSLTAVSGDFVLFDREAEVTIVDDDSQATLDCSMAIPAPEILWPPNHKYRSITISGVLDNNGNDVGIMVQQVFQDELVEGEGDGNTQPDAVIDVTGGVQVRAERSGLEDGRIYEIIFNAISNDGATCTGTVSVGVPHDKGQGSVPIDSGVRYDSTASAN